MRLRKMRPDEFGDYVAYFVPDYAAEISTNYDVDIETARARAEREVARSLPKGVETEDQILLCVVHDDADTAVGYLWCHPDNESQSVFISDFCILPPYRGRGYGRSALVALEAMFAQTEFKELRLRVAADNYGAECLYRSMGYRPTGINMRRPIANSERP